MTVDNCPKRKLVMGVTTSLIFSPKNKYYFENSFGEPFRRPSVFYQYVTYNFRAKNAKFRASVLKLFSSLLVPMHDCRDRFSTLSIM